MSDGVSKASALLSGLEPAARRSRQDRLGGAQPRPEVDGGTRTATCQDVPRSQAGNTGPALTSAEVCGTGEVGFPSIRHQLLS